MWIFIPTSLLSLVCMVSLWRGPDRLPSKIAWTILLAVPMLGPLLYGGIHQAPSKTGINPREPSEISIDAALYFDSTFR
jgi:hypothetical protein